MKVGPSWSPPRKQHIDLSHKYPSGHRQMTIPTRDIPNGTGRMSQGNKSKHTGPNYGLVKLVKGPNFTWNPLGNTNSPAPPPKKKEKKGKDLPPTQEQIPPPKNKNKTYRPLRNKFPSQKQKERLTAHSEEKKKDLPPTQEQIPPPKNKNKTYRPLRNKFPSQKQKERLTAHSEEKKRLTAHSGTKSPLPKTKNVASSGHGTPGTFAGRSSRGRVP